jgi:hypothetical protein
MSPQTLCHVIPTCHAISTSPKKKRATRPGPRLNYARPRSPDLMSFARFVGKLYTDSCSCTCHAPAKRSFRDCPETGNQRILLP